MQLTPNLRRRLPAVILGVVATTALVALVLSPRSESAHIDLDLSPRVPLSAEVDVEQERLRVAVASMLTPSSNFEAYRQLIDYLGARVGARTELVQRSGYSAVNELLAAGEVDLGFVCSGAWIHLRRTGGAKILAAPVVNGETSYRSLILTRAGIWKERFTDLRGATFAYVDLISQTGYYFPVTSIVGAGLSPDDFFAATTFTGSHERSIELVAAGLVDAAAVDSLIYDWMVVRQPLLAEKVRILIESEPFSIPPVVVGKGVEPEQTEALRRVLLGMHEDERGRQALAALGFDRFVDGRRIDYASVERTVDAAPEVVTP